MPKKIVSGGQTGVDRAALDAAIQLNIPHGGWCPKNRKAEDGAIDAKYLLKETDSEEYSERTKANIRDSDGTLILMSPSSTISEGTILTIEEAKKSKPYLVIDLSEERMNIEKIHAWMNQNGIQTLNVAGPRESQSPGIYQKSLRFLCNFFLSLKEADEEKNVYIKAKL